MERRLQRIYGALSELIAWHEPKAMAIESVYFGKNVHSAMAVGQASGVAMLAAAQGGIGCFAYTPQAIKMAVCGAGGAGKEQVQRMVGTLLGLLTRIAALGGALISLSLWLTVSWAADPYYYGNDLPYLMAWTPLILAGAPLLSVDAALRARRRRGTF